MVPQGLLPGEGRIEGSPRLPQERLRTVWLSGHGGPGVSGRMCACPRVQEGVGARVSANVYGSVSEDVSVRACARACVHGCT